MSDTIERRAFDALARHSDLSAVLALAEPVLGQVYRPATPWHERTVDSTWDEGQRQTPFGDLVRVLSHGPRDDAERALASALAAHSIAHAATSGALPAELARRAVSLASYSPFDPTPLLDVAFGASAGPCWEALGHMVSQADVRYDDITLRTEAISAALALSASTDLAARSVVARLEVHDTRLRCALRGNGEPPEKKGNTVAPTCLHGELLPTPRGPIATTFLALSGILFLARGARAFARLALGYRRPTDVIIAEDSVKIRTKTEMLGRVLADSEVVVPRFGLLRAQRDIRYPRVTFYAGLIALFLGSAIGMGLFTDGVRAASPSLLGVGLLIASIGVGLDFFFSSLRPSVNGACRLTFVPRRGKALSIGGVDPAAADVLLARIQTLPRAEGVLRASPSG